VEYRQLRSETGSTTPNPVSTWQTFLSVGHVTFYRALKVRISAGKTAVPFALARGGTHAAHIQEEPLPKFAFANARRGIVKRHRGMHHYPKCKRPGSAAGNKTGSRGRD
jgi:hypothetical protein